MLDIAGPPARETLRPSQLARRQRIVRAALRALAGSEYDRVKISEVARESGVALGPFTAISRPRSTCSRPFSWSGRAP